MLLRSATEQTDILRDRNRDIAASKYIIVERRMSERGKEKDNRKNN
jgi:hypothetical protein